MASPYTDEILDEILAIQLLVAWAGEGRSSPRRLGWWDTDLVDEAGGGDLFARLAPRTHRWAALECVREAALRVDAKARSKMPPSDALRSLYFLGFELDERLADRLASHKREGKLPAEALPFPRSLAKAFSEKPGEAEFSKDALASALQRDDASFTTVPNGRELTHGKKAAPPAPEVLVRQLAATLVPLAEHYPLPFYIHPSPAS